MTKLPIEAALPDLRAALLSHNMAVLQAPPGAGKTTRVPLFLLEENLCKGRVLMLEPRRLAARAAAERLAETLGEPVGKTVGYRMRGDSKTSDGTRIEVITEGILTRIAQNDPDLTGIGCIIFDEFHERSLQADTGLAFALEIRSVLREDLQLIAMSATLDAAPVAALMGNAPVITSAGRSYPVTAKHLESPWKKPNRKSVRFETAAATLIETAVNETTGGILVFLPGEGEIRRVQSLLNGRLPPDVVVRPLCGAMPFTDQRKAVAPETNGRKLVLSTSIAETSLTIQDIRVVVDCGQARRARFDTGSGMSRLVTERVTKAEATQRQGRAGRVAEGHCYKLWTKGEEGSFMPFPLPEILSADITNLVLELAMWGTSDPTDLPFLDVPRDTDVAQAQSLLRNLGALDAKNRITDHGRRLAKTPTHARLAHMLEFGGKDAPLVAALLENRDPLPRGSTTDLKLRIEVLDGKAKNTNANPVAIKTIRSDAKRLGRKPDNGFTLAETVALAYPDRIGLRRNGDMPRFVLSGGKGAVLDETDPLGNQRLIIAVDLDGNTREAKVRRALPITQSELTNVYGDKFTEVNLCQWSKRERRVLTRKQMRFDALVLEDQNWKDCPVDGTNEAMCEGLRDLGLAALPWKEPARLFRARIAWLAKQGHPLPDFSNDVLINTLEDWIMPHLSGIRNAEGLKKLDLAAILRNQLDWQEQQTVDELAPSHIKAPTGTKLAVDYSGEQPKISVRIQELYGLVHHPTVGPKRLPLLIELLSPARRALQTTADLVGFWKSSYQDVRKDMRGRYPRHPWPEDPTQAEATRRVKPRK